MDLEVHLRRMYKTDREFAVFIDGLGIEPDKEEILRTYNSICIERMFNAAVRKRRKEYMKTEEGREWYIDAARRAFASAIGDKDIDFSDVSQVLRRIGITEDIINAAYEQIQTAHFEDTANTER